ncbi:hypothetical protein PR002_g24994 [Phytophthora rubi]|uniref:Uncharacterized protein n=1 Tax=Phytophthora rubi TaxID=129364 RepID=A0A6A3ICD3_9STRA|nr:hypothetical protein PR002_g24994 [Phytophthora rubi]
MAGSRDEGRYGERVTRQACDHWVTKFRCYAGGQQSQSAHDWTDKERTLEKLVAMRDAQVEQIQAPSERSAPTVLVTTNSSSIVEAHTLAGCFYNWYPLDRDGVSYRLCKQTLWTLAEELDKKTNQALVLLDNKGRCKTAGSLRKRWRKLRVENRATFDALCSVYILRKGNEGIVDHCTPGIHLWQAKDFK